MKLFYCKTPNVSKMWEYTIMCPTPINDSKYWSWLTWGFGICVSLDKIH